VIYHDSVKYIEDMNPGHVNAVGEECLRTRDIIRKAAPTLDGLRGKVEWAGDAADLYEQRLAETVDLTDALHDGFAKAGQAVTDYAQAQTKATALVADGVSAENRLGALIASIVATQSVTVQHSDALRAWHDLRSSTGITDWIAEVSVQDQIDKVRGEADHLWHTATGAYDDALRIETNARDEAVTQLAAAYKLLPDFLANSQLSGKIVAETPNLLDMHGKYHIGPPTAPHFTYNDDFPYDPSVIPAAADHLNWAKWSAMLAGGDALRPDLDDALDAYAHYRDGTGTDMQIDYDEAYREDPNIHKAVDTEILSAQQNAERIARETGQTGFQMTGNPSSVVKLGGYPTTENWQKTLGDHNIYGTSDVEVNGNQITMKIKVHADDMYNFNHGAADIETGKPDDANGRFSTLGWAKQFHTYGEVERTVTWTIGDPTSVVTRDGTSPHRDTGGEDRVDGRHSG
jgi:hypothetical protein